MKFLTKIAKLITTFYTVIKIAITIIKLKKVTETNMEIADDAEIAEAIKQGDTKKIAQIIEYYKHYHKK